MSARAALKGAVDLAAALVVLPLVLGFRAQRRLAPGRTDVAYQGYAQLLGLVPGVLGVVLRRAFYRRTLRGCGRAVSVGFCTIIATPEAELGENIYVGPFCNIGSVTVGDDVLLGSNVTLLGGGRQHLIDRLDVPVRLQGSEPGRVTLGRDVWVGNGAIVMADVGAQAVVAAGAVVVKPVPPRAIVGGNPARVISTRGTEAPAQAPAQAPPPAPAASAPDPAPVGAS